MAMTIRGQVGPQVLVDGTEQSIRMGKFGSMVVQELHSRYYEQMYRGNIFLASTQASTAVTNLATTATGLILSNPANSGKNLTLIDITLIQTSTAAATANAGIVLAANVNPIATATVHTTPLTIQPGLLGSGISSVAKADSAATLPAAPVVIRAIWQPSVSATATTSIPAYVKDEIAGLISVAPGCTVSLSAFSAISVVAAMTWEENPI